MTEQTTSKKITVGLILSWIFGILFALTGIISVFSEPVPGIVMLIMAAVLLPPVNKLVDEKWKFHLSGGMKAVVIIIGFIIFGSTIDTSKQQNNQPPVQQEQSVSNIEQKKDEIKPTEEQPKTTNNEKPVETEKTEIIPTPQEKPEPTKEASVPAEYKSALNKATMYAKTMHMSKQGVYDQLVSEYGEKFSADAAQYAIDNMTADWNANALVKAKTYQDTMNMSPSAIHDQLTSAYGEKFTKSEADYAIQHLND
ncbi:MAG: Ltp family lipoprotein [Patescibacteria group bacterium]|jgi:type IV secretory pathway VirB10-like protein|nr:Ltp family lipoprotein [Patescibacteria group bacterium]